eukprot:GHVQ01042819.1.p1 GENE.GHVQ01042819.1~~GHVQ01042819.1.p1  ORF type:complete len:126 (+),score=7.12 GHVQ01042819.1:750-1127(+)
MTMFNLSPVMLGLHRQSMLRCADNSGPIKACVVGMKNRHATGGIGTWVRMVVRDKKPGAPITHHMPKGIIVRKKDRTQRKDGMVFKFSENAYATVSKNKPKGTKIRGPTLLEVRHNLKNICKYIF